MRITAACASARCIRASIGSVTATRSRWNTTSSSRHDAFVAKIAAIDGSLPYSGFIGGSSADNAAGITVDAAGNADIVRSTRSPGYPTLNALQTVIKPLVNWQNQRCDDAAALRPARNGFRDAFVAKFSPAGDTLAYSSCLGGEDIFVTKLPANGKRRLFSTFLGARGNEAGVRLAVGSDGAVYVTGNTASRNVPV